MVSSLENPNGDWPECYRQFFKASLQNEKTWSLSVYIFIYISGWVDMESDTSD